MLAGRAVADGRPGLPAAEREQVLAAARSTTPAPRHAGPRAQLRDDRGHGGRSTSPSATSPPRARRLGREPRRRARRPLALLPAAGPRRRPLDPDPLGDLRDRGVDPSALRRRPPSPPRWRPMSPASPVISLVPTQLAGCSTPAPPSTGSASLLIGGAALDRATLEEALGRGRDRRPDLRPDRGLLAGLHARPRRGARARSAPAGRPLPGIEVRDRGRRDPRPRARPSPPRPPTTTAGSAPATSAASTTRATSGSRAGPTT